MVKIITNDTNLLLDIFTANYTEFLHKIQLKLNILTNN